MSEGVNVNTNTAVPQGGPIEVRGGEHVTFDDMESMSFEAPSKPSPKKEAKAPKEEKVESEGSDDEETDEGETQAEPKDKKPKDEAKDKSDKEKAAKEATDKLDKKGKQDQFKTNKKYKIELDGKPVDIPGEAMFKVKDQDVPLQELLNNYHGKVAYDKKFQDLAARGKEFDSTIQELNDNLAHAYKLAMDEGNPKGMIAYISELIGADPVKVWKDMKAQMRKQMGVAEGDIDPNEDQADELELLRQEKARNSERATKAQTHRELQQATDKVMEKYGMTNADLVKTYDDMVLKGLKARSPEEVAEYWQQNQSQSMAHEIVGELGDLENSEEVVSLIIETKSKYPEFTKDDLKEVVSEALGLKDKASKALSRKVKHGSSQSKPHAKASGDALFFDDLD